MWFDKNIQISCVFNDRELFFFHFPCFSCAVGTMTPVRDYAWGRTGPLWISGLVLYHRANSPPQSPVRYPRPP